MLSEWSKVLALRASASDDARGSNPLHGALIYYGDVIPSLVEGYRLKTGDLVSRGFKSHLPYFSRLGVYPSGQRRPV